jgi:spore coat protein A, manganese oxidase
MGNFQLLGRCGTCGIAPVAASRQVTHGLFACFFLQHPVHLHLVDFRIVRRHKLVFDSQSDDDYVCQPGRGSVDGICLETKPQMQHDGSIGKGYRAFIPNDVTYVYNRSEPVEVSDAFVESADRKDVVATLPGQVTVIRATFVKRGKYVWHCHILSHEDHEMMRRYEVI